MGSRRPSSCISYEAPFSSLAFRDDGLILAAGTSSGRVVFYDVRGKPQPFTVLRAYSSSEVNTFTLIFPFNLEIPKLASFFTVFCLHATTCKHVH